MNHAIADICYRASRLNPEVAREPGDCFIRGQWRPGGIHWGTNMTVCRNWQDLAWTDFRSLPDDTVAILPVAAVEQHGPHLPVSVDATINAGLMVRALALLPDDATVLALPMQSVGLSVEHVRFPGTLTLSAETLIAVLTEIGRSVARAGVRRLVVLNSHGGQPQVVEIVCRRLRADAMLAVSCMASRLGLPPGVSLSRDEARHGIHGGLVETSMMLHLRPDLVRMQHAADFRSAWLAQEASMSVLSPRGRCRLRVGDAGPAPIRRTGRCERGLGGAGRRHFGASGGAAGDVAGRGAAVGPGQLAENRSHNLTSPAEAGEVETRKRRG
jgi:creatinine amidohydrolase